MALMEYGHVRPAQALALIAAMPLDTGQQRSLRATVRRWAKALRDAGHAVPED
jgi:hypothetical protein